MDGRLLARIVDQGGRPFVLDYGDDRVIADAVQRINRGFTTLRHGRLVHVHPQDLDLIEQLASFYVGEGALVFLEEPTWSGRPAPVPGSAFLRDYEDADDDPTEMT